MTSPIDLDDEVHLTIRNNRRGHESDNEVLRRLLRLDGRTTPSAIGRNAGASRPKSISELLDEKQVLAGDRLRWSHKDHGMVYAVVNRNGSLTVEGVGTFTTVSAPLRELSGTEVNGWVAWRLERTGETLHKIRQRIQLERESRARKIVVRDVDQSSPTPSRSTIHALRAFVDERDWDQFHSPENLAKSISIESAELLECFQWSPDFNQTRVEEELADVVTYCIHLANKIGVDLDDIVMRKLESTRAKYPVELAKGRMTKYTKLAKEQE